jgi:aminobenzoyl-glutamate utilization protein B
MRFHYVITDGGEQPNVVPAHATVWYYLRHTDFAKLEDLLDKTRTVAQSAAAMSQTTVTEHILASSWPLNGNRELATLLQKNVDAVGMPDWSSDDVAFAKAFQKAMDADVVGLPTAVTPLRHLSQGSSSSDVGDVTWIVPYARLSFPSQVQGIKGNHHWSAAIAVATPVAHKGLVVGAKALAGTLVDLYTDPSNLVRIKADFAQQVAGVKWRSLIPDGQKPPIEINADKMAKWAPLFAPYYYDPDSPKTLLEQWGVAYPPKGN